MWLHGVIPALLLGNALGAAITIDYPAEGSIFPPEITAPTFLWRDAAKTAAAWRIDVSFADGAAPLHATSRGPRMRIGEIDPRCVAETNRPPTLTPLEAAAHTWVPDAALWETIKRHSQAGAATVTITGFRSPDSNAAVSRGQVTIRTSRDPVGAPIFYRDVPLMPTETEKGVIQPLAAHAVRLIEWRVRNVAESRSHVVMENVPVCANCHSFSADGKTLGMDLDGLQQNKGLYTLTPLKRETAIRSENVIQWSSAQGRLKGALRIGFMSRVSPDGRYVVTTIDSPGTHPGSRSNYYVANFKDYRFLQVFYPTRGILSWYSRKTGILQPLPGADDPRFVQTNAVWSPDGRYLVFARAEARDPDSPGLPLAKFANDPNELQIRYDLYRIPFRDGRGGTPEPIAGASHDGMSNTFPKISPDGRWIVFVKCRNGLLMRPDSQLYIVPAAGGEARRMRCNAAPMNSWHSFSPNGRWLVFSSKRRSPYTQMYLTHIDEDGSDSPAILIENTTAANRAVNLPEFINIAPDALRSVGGPAIDYYRFVDRAAYLQKNGRFEESAAEWEKVLAIKPDDAMAHRSLGMALLLAGRREEAATHLQKATELELRAALAADPEQAPVYNKLGLLLLDEGRVEEAAAAFRKAAELDPKSAAARSNLGRALAREGKVSEALAAQRKAVELDPRYAPAHYQSGLLLDQRGEKEEAIREWRAALAIEPKYPEAHGSLGNALYANGDLAGALAEWREALDLKPNDAPTLRRTAWLLATGPRSSLRNGKEAVALAVRAVELSRGRDPEVLDTLAAAYAEAGRFADAALTAQRAMALAAQTNRVSLARALKGRIALYEADRPFRAK